MSADDGGFAEALRGFGARLRGSAGFRAGVPVTLARAPGRLDLMGGIADYSGSLVLQWPIREAALVAFQPGGDGRVTVESLASGEATRRIELDAGRWSRLVGGADYAAIRRELADRPEDHWAAYVVGVLLVLSRERGVDVSAGAQICLESEVPEGKGVSSSAAIEVATMRAAARALGVEVSGIEMATLCQVAENHVVGAPCGIMDQMASALGQADQLLALLCQPAEVQGYATLPESLGVWGIDSGIRHAVTGSDYMSVRVGAAMGHRILNEITSAGAGGVDYLANIEVGEFESTLEAQLPERMQGRAFLERYDGLMDRVVTVDPERKYAVRQPTAHPVREHARVCRFREILEGGAGAVADRVELGRLMFGSHASYSACGLGSEGTDRLVAMVREAGPSRGLYGAKITGGGSGGTVAVLGRWDAAAAVAELAGAYGRETGRTPYVFEGSSPGAMQVEPVTLRW